MLLSPALSDNDWVNALEMGRVRQDFDRGLSSIGISSGVGSSQVVLDVTRGVFNVSNRSDALELSEDDFKRLSHNVSEHVQSTSVRHSNDDLLGSVVTEFIDQRLHTWDERVDSFESESLHGVELLGNEGGELVSPKESVEELDFLFVGDLLVLHEFKSVSDPSTLITVRNVDKLETDLLAVGVRERLDQLSEGPSLLPLEHTTELWHVDKECPIEIRFLEMIILIIHVSCVIHPRHKILVSVRLDFLKVQGIDISNQVAVRVESSDQGHDLECIALSLLGAYAGSDFLDDASNQSQLFQCSDNAIHVRHSCGCAAAGVVAKDWRGLVRFLGSLVDVSKVGIPRGVHAGGVVLPLLEQHININCRCSVGEVVHLAERLHQFLRSSKWL